MHRRRRQALAHVTLALLALGTVAAASTPGASAAELALGPVARGQRPAPRAIAAARRGPSVGTVLLTLQRTAAISEAQYRQYYASYVAANRSLARLGGTRRSELAAVLANLQAIAAAGELTASRAPVLFLTLERNRQWWTTEPLLSNGVRVAFPQSKLVWQYYAGQGIEIQWLATFGKANGYYNSGHENANLRQVLAEAIPLASRRAGGIAWEYMFQFDGGRPPWTSALSQGTALQAISRAWSRFKEPADLAAAQQALGIFQTPPPQGVHVATSAGALYAQYSFAPADRILNGFVQSLVGLYEYTSITGDPLGLHMFEAGDAEARVEVPRYDTGGWSLYDQFGESSLNYHELLTEFLSHLCERTRRGLPAAPAPPPPAPAPQPPAPGTTTSPPATSGGGTPSPTGAAGAAHAAAAHAAAPIAADQIYCTTAQRFTADLHTPPLVALVSHALKGGTRAGVQISLSKISSVRMTIRQGSRVVWTNGATLEHGRPRLLWPTPAAGGTFTVTLTASDLVGNFATATGSIAVSRR